MIRWFEKHNKISWTITIIGAILIFYISSLTFSSVSKTPGPSFPTSIIYHILSFFLFSFFLFISLTEGKKEYFLFIIGIMTAIIYGIFDEIHQFFVPGRFCSITDVFYDSIGIVFSFMIYFISIKYKENISLKRQKL